jgi:threonine/homoserine/homoserine lactone efflux protein
MSGIQNYSSFIIAIIAFQIFPGAGTVAILNATARNGIGTGMKAVFGTLVGDFIYMLAAVLGLAAVLRVYPIIFESTKWIGVAYLCWTGWKFFRVSLMDQPANMSFNKTDWAYFRQALAVSLTNPKVILFFMAFFPLFLSSESTTATLLTLMAHITAISFIYQTCLVIVGNAVAGRLSKWKYMRIFAARIAGFLLIFFGVNLAFNIR